MLARTPETLTGLLVGPPEQWLHRDGPPTWSAYDIVGHLLLADTTRWLPRIGMVLECGTDRQFEPFDREAMLGWQREPAAALLQRLRTTRSASLAHLDDLGLADEDLQRRGVHPEFVQDCLDTQPGRDRGRGDRTWSEDANPEGPASGRAA